jgi:hypothetical protein
MAANASSFRSALNDGWTEILIPSWLNSKLTGSCPVLSLHNWLNAYVRNKHTEFHHFFTYVLHVQPIIRIVSFKSNKRQYLWETDTTSKGMTSCSANGLQPLSGTGTILLTTVSRQTLGPTNSVGTGNSFAWGKVTCALVWGQSTECTQFYGRSPYATLSRHGTYTEW